MTIATLPAPLANPTPAPISRDIPDMPIYRLSVKQYHQMIDAGVFASDDRIELIDGWLVPKMSKNPPHSHATRMLRKWLEHLGIPNVYVDSQEPLYAPNAEVPGSRPDSRTRYIDVSDLRLVPRLICRER